MTLTEAIRTDMNLFVAEDWPLVFTLRDDLDVPIILNGATVQFVIKQTPAASANLFSQAATIANQVDEPGVARVRVMPEENKTWTGMVYYELQVTLANGLVRKAAFGFITIQPTGIR